MSKGGILYEKTTLRDPHSLRCSNVHALRHGACRQCCGIYVAGYRHFLFHAPDFKILSRDSYKTDPAAEELPYPQENLDEWFAGDYYFIGASDAAYCIFSLRAYPDGHDRFAAIIEDGELDALTNALADSFVEDGSEVLSAETYPHAENTVLRFGYLDTDEDGSTDYNVTFFTVCGENTVRIDFWFPFSAGSAEQDALADGVIDSMKFSAAVPQPRSPAGTAKTIVSCVLLAAVIVALGVLSRKMRKDKEAAAKAMASDALTHVPPAPAEAPAAPDTKYCACCGEKISAGSRYAPGAARSSRRAAINNKLTKGRRPYENSVQKAP